MKIKTSLKWIAVVALLFTILAPRDADARHRNNNIVEYLAADGRFTTLIAAVQAAGLVDTLAEGGPFTLMAPTDAAFAALPEGTVEALLQDPQGALTDILLYHVLEGRRSAYHLLRSNTAITLNGNPLLFKRDRWRVTVNGGPIINPNRRAKNGLIHVINSVLLPPEEPVAVNSIVDVLALDGRFNTLLAAVEAAGLVDAVASGELTLFAPTDEAFAALPEGTVETLLMDPQGALTDILLYHVLEGRQDAVRLIIDRTAVTLQGASVKVAFDRRRAYVNDSQILDINISAPNGLIHVIDGVLLPPEPAPDLVTLLEGDGRFTTLLAALDAAGLTETVRSGGPFTVFAPTDDAFAALPAGTVETLLEDPSGALTDILLYHVVDGRRTARSLARERTVETLQGSEVKVRGWWNWIRVNNAHVVIQDLEASNGLGQVINAVLIPPTL